jgi:GNAT superfamily N-acetyltransferase
MNVRKMGGYNEDFGHRKYNIRTIKPEETLPLREKVMWPGRPEMCKLKDDNNGIHLGYYCSGDTQEEEEHLVGVISIFVNKKERTAQFRKFAVDQNYQGKGIGSTLLETAIKNMKRYNIDDDDNDDNDCEEEQINSDDDDDDCDNKNKKLRIFYCDARSNLVSFYEKLGFYRVGEPFIKYETKPDQMYHIRMEMELQKNE